MPAPKLKLRFHAVLAAIVSLTVGVSSSFASLVVYPKPPEEPSSPDYTVNVRTTRGGPEFIAVPVYGSCRYDGASKETLWGRPVSPISFCSIDANEETQLEVRFEKSLADAGIDLKTVIVRPLALGIKPAVENGAIRFKINKQPCQITVEPGGGLQRPLHIFLNPIETRRPTTGAANLIYFGPGYHEIDGFTLKDGQTVYVAGGAVLELKPHSESNRGPVTGEVNGKPTYLGRIFLLDANQRKNITIRGRGILSCRKALQAGQRSNFVGLEGVRNVNIEGLILRESGSTGLHAVNSDHVRISNVKAFCPYVNGDGIIMGGTSQALVENCFVHNADDSFEIKVWRPQSDVEFRNCVVWNDLGGCFGLFHESGSLSSNVVFRNCTVLHSTDDASASPVIGIKLDGIGKTAGYVFENIVVEQVSGPRRPAIKVFNNWTGWTLTPDDPAHPYQLNGGKPHNPPPGAISNVVFKNIAVLEAANSDVVLMADGPASPISNIRFEGVTLNGRKLEAQDARLKTNQWVTGVKIK